MELSLTKLPWYAQVGAFRRARASAAVGAFYYYYEMPVRADMGSRAVAVAAPCATTSPRA